MIFQIGERVRVIHASANRNDDTNLVSGDEGIVTGKDGWNLGRDERDYCVKLDKNDTETWQWHENLERIS